MGRLYRYGRVELNSRTDAKAKHAEAHKQKVEQLATDTPFVKDQCPESKAYQHTATTGHRNDCNQCFIIRQSMEIARICNAKKKWNAKD